MNSRFPRVFLIVAILSVSACLTVAAVPGAQNSRLNRDAETALADANNKVVIGGNAEAAIQEYKKIIERYGGNPDVVARAYLFMGNALENLRRVDEARAAYRHVIDDFAGQRDAADKAQARWRALTVTAVATKAAPKGIEPVLSSANRGLWEAVTRDGRYISNGNPSRVTLRDTVTKTEGAIIDAGDSGDRVGRIAFSADDKWVAYAWYDAAAETYELRTLPLHPSGGTQPKVLLRSAEFIYNAPFGWSPDGNAVYAVVTGKDRANTIVAIAAEGGAAPRTIKSLEWRWPDKLSISPNGRYIAYDAPIEKDSRDRDIFVYSIETGVELDVERHPARDALPVWTPDGNAIVFASDRSEGVGLWIAEITDGVPRGKPAPILRNTGGALFPLGFSADGSFYYVHGANRTDVHISTRESARAWFQSARELRYSGRNSDPAYSPDGSHLAYFSRSSPGFLNAQPNVGGLLTLVIVRTADSIVEKEIPTLFTEVSGPAWFPDGQSLLFASRGNASIEPYALRRIDVQTGVDLIPQTIETAAASPVAVAPNGESIYYTRDAANRRRLMKYQLSARQETELFRDASPGSEMGERIVVSPDGRWVAFTLRDGPPTAWTLQVIAASGGTPKGLENPQGAARLTAIQWSADGKEVLAQSEPQGLLWRFPSDGGKVQRADDQGHSRIANIHPDGKQIAVVETDGHWEVAAARNFLRPDSADRDIFLARIDPATGKIRGPIDRLTNNLVFADQMPAWSPDGKSIAFKRGRLGGSDSGGFHVVIRFLDGTERANTRGNPAQGGVRPIWFADSNRLIVAGDANSHRHWNWQTGEFFPMIDMADVEPVRYPSFSHGALSADGRFYLPVTPKDRPAGSFDGIAVLDPLSGQRERTFPVPENISTLALSPNSKTLAILVIENQSTFQAHLALVGIDGVGYRKIPYGFPVEQGAGMKPVWIDNGRAILFAETDGDGKSRVMRIAADGKSKPEFTGLTIGPYWGIDVNPEGTRIVFSASAKDISLMEPR